MLKKTCYTAAIVLSLFLTKLNAGATNYYVSPGGSDSAAGTFAQPFKTLQKGADVAQPGDTVFARTGSYNQVGVSHATRGLISLMMKRSGTAAAPIVFMSYPGESPVISGMKVISEWQQCSSPNMCGGNPNWQNIYYTDYDLGQDIMSVRFIEKDSFPFVAMDPNPTDPFYWEQPGPWKLIPTPGYTDSSITDASYLTQPTSAYFDPSYVGVWSGNNNIFIQKISSFDPATNTIRFPPFSAPLNLGKDKYCIINHISVIDRKGEYYYDAANKRLFYWPYDAANLNSQMQYTYQDIGVYINNKSYVEINGFKIIGHGTGITNVLTGAPMCYGVKILNNRVSYTKGSGISITYASESLIEGNSVSYTGHHGIQFTGTSGSGKVYNNTITNNYLTKIGGSGLRFSQCNNCSMTNNVNEYSEGQHANGISIYAFSSNIFLRGNVIRYCNIALAISQSDSIDIYENIFIGGVHAWSYANDLYKFNLYNNTIKGGVNFADNYKERSFYNNISSGLTNPKQWNHSNNLFLKLSWTQTDTLALFNESLETDSSKVFIDFENGNYNLRGITCGMPAVNPCTMAANGMHVGALFCDLSTLGVTATPVTNDITVYPNPFKNELNISAATGSEGLYQLYIYDMLGNIVYAQKAGLNAGTEKITLEGLPAGIYTIMLYNDKNERVNTIKTIKTE